MKQQWKTALVGALMAVGGMVAGTWLAGQPAEAQTGGYTVCFFGSQEWVDVDASGHVATPRADRLIEVPSGYDVVSGGGSPAGGVILFCRR